MKMKTTDAPITPAKSALTCALDRACEEAFADDLDDDGGEVAGSGDPMASESARQAELSQAEINYARRQEQRFPVGAGSIPQAKLRELVAIRLTDAEREAWHDAKASLKEIDEELAAVARGAAKERLTAARSILAGGTLDLEALAEVEPLSQSRPRDHLRRSALKGARRAVEAAAGLALVGLAHRSAAALEREIETVTEADVALANRYGLRPTPSAVVGAIQKALSVVSQYREGGRVPLGWVEEIVEASELAPK